jgi:hypothetical protein
LAFQVTSSNHHLSEVAIFQVVELQQILILDAREPGVKRRPTWGSRARGKKWSTSLAVVEAIPSNRKSHRLMLFDSN